MRNTILLMITVGLFSCGKSRTEINPINLRYVDTLYLETFVESFSVIPLELTQNSIIDNVSRLIMYDDYFLVVENSRTNKAITIFNSSGRYIRRISNFGRGPGEYLSITAFEVDQTSRNLYVYDNFSRSVYIYDSLGTFTDKIDVDGLIASDFKILDDSTFAFYSPDEVSEFQNKTYPKGLLVHKIKENKFESLLEYSEDTEIVRAFNSGWFTQGEGYVGLLSSIENKYYKVSDGKAIAEYSFLLPFKEIGYNDKSVRTAFKAYPVESNKYIFFYVFFKDGTQFFPVLFDKENGDGFIYSWLKGFLDSTATIFQGANSECFFRVILPQRLSPKEIQTLERDFNVSISENDNPLLIIYHLK